MEVPCVYRSCGIPAVYCPYPSFLSNNTFALLTFFTMKNRIKTLACTALAIFTLGNTLFAQNYRQTVKGIVLDKKIQEPLPGTTIRIETGDTMLQVITDTTGRFRIEQVPIGRHSIVAIRLGYKVLIRTDIAVQSGKETDITMEMEEQLIASQEVVVSGKSEQVKPLNPFAVNSARSFSVEETQRYAAAANDPARMASAYAGVAVPGDDNNTIVIRGNAPNGLLWRLEGIDIPNPNHFSNAGSTGGAISVLSAQVLGESDFFTGAFPAEYGNALSGVFDLKLRKGNTERQEYTFQAGLLGLEAAMEGPLHAGRQKGSFLFNYRFSSLYLLSKMGIEIGDVKTKFQDFSFNTWVAAGKFGELSFFCIAGISAEKLPGQPDSVVWRRRPDQRFNSLFRADMGVLGLSHHKIWGNTHWKQVLAWSGGNNIDRFERYRDDYTLQPISIVEHRQKRLTYSSVLSHKFSVRHFIRGGFYATSHHVQLAQSIFNPVIDRSVETINWKGETATLDAFFQWQYRPIDQLTFNTGIHTFFLLLNGKQSIEPRASVKYTFKSGQSLGFSYGLHAQMQPIGVYFSEDSTGMRLNPNLDLTKSQHFVASYHLKLDRFWQLKTELYYQGLYQVPVSATFENSYSILNEIDGFPGAALINAGRGHNYGLECSLEHPLATGFYLLFSASLYQSKYHGSDGKWRNTRYNGNLLGNFVCGKEWNRKRKNRQRSIALNLKVTYFGGLREAPVDVAASGQIGFTVRDYDHDFEFQLPAYFRIDPGFRIKRHYAHATATFFIDIQNATNRLNVRSSFYHPLSKAVDFNYQEGLIPIIGYKMEF